MVSGAQVDTPVAPAENRRVVSELIPFRKERRVRDLSATPSRMVCRKCGDKRLERRHRKHFIHWLLSYFSIYPYQCAKCFRGQLRFAPSSKLIQPILLIVLLCGNVALLAYRMKAADAGGDQAGAGAMSRTRATSGNLTPFERMMLAKKQQTLRNDDVVLMLSSGVAPALVIKMIDASNGVYDLSPRGVLQLKHANVADVVVEAMMDHSLASAAGSQ